jgi:hypothetical protein
MKRSCTLVCCKTTNQLLINQPEYAIEEYLIILVWIDRYAYLHVIRMISLLTCLALKFTRIFNRCEYWTYLRGSLLCNSCLCIGVCYLGRGRSQGGNQNAADAIWPIGTSDLTWCDLIWAHLTSIIVPSSRFRPGRRRCIGRVLYTWVKFMNRWPASQ